MAIPPGWGALFSGAARRHAFGLFLHQLLQGGLVGLTLGMVRTMVPALAESDFGVPRNACVLRSAFVVALGLVKGCMHFIAGRWSERIGRHPLNVAGMGVCGAGVVAMVLGEGGALPGRRNPGAQGPCALHALKPPRGPSGSACAPGRRYPTMSGFPSPPFPHRFPLPLGPTARRGKALPGRPGAQHAAID
ncbi:MAG: hypothetical protein PHI55_06380 [Burkholderiaceae bacterium]|nr:hypothetical protein [Burkholderiaceae bacterium]